MEKLLEQNAIEAVDLVIAKNALKAQEKEVEVQQIIYYGSPLAQQLTEENRVSYSFQVTALALFPSIISVNFFDEQFNVSIPKPKFHIGQPVIVDAFDEMDETDYLITGIALNYTPEHQPYWSYCVGDKDESFLEYNFAESWHDETDLLPKRIVGQKLPLFRGHYYVLIAENNQVWDGTNWTTIHWNAKHYESWTAAKSAQHQLQFNPKFKAKKSEIKAIFKP